MAQRFYMPRATALDANGFPGSGYKLNFYITGTSTRLDTFSNQALTSKNTNPVVADGNGRFGEIWLQAKDYKVVLTDAADVTIWTADPVVGIADVSAAEKARYDRAYALTVFHHGGL